MSFQNTKTHSSSSHADLKLERENLIQELNQHGLALEDLKQQKSKYKDLTNELDILEEQIEKAKVSISNFQRVIVDLTEQRSRIADHKTSLQNEVKELEDQKIVKQKELQELEDKKVSLLSDHQSMAGKHASLLDDINQRIEVQNQQLVDLTNQTLIKQTELEDLVQQVESTRTSLLSLQEELSELRSSIVQNKDFVNSKKQELLEVTDKVEQTKKQIENISVECTKVQMETDRFVKEEKAKIESTQLELNKQRGDIQIRNQWLNEKELKLKQAKEELEKFYGRKINHINF